MDFSQIYQQDLNSDCEEEDYISRCQNKLSSFSDSGVQKWFERFLEDKFTTQPFYEWLYDIDQRLHRYNSNRGADLKWDAIVEKWEKYIEEYIKASPNTGFVDYVLS